MLLSEYMVNQMISKMGKGSYPSINQNDVNELDIPLPAYQVQQAIVECIENEHVLIKASRQLIALYEQKIKDRINKLWNG
jgi:type I restriction enzyme M protein